jgi:hypothetical protein
LHASPTLIIYSNSHTEIDCRRKKSIPVVTTRLQPQ